MTATNDGDRDRFSWRAHPAREQPGRAGLALGVIAAFALLAGQLMQSPWWIAFAAAIPLIILNRFFLPSRFRMDETGVHAAYPFTRRSIRWNDLRRFAHDERGGLLSPRPYASRFDARQGVLVLFGDCREAVLERIRPHLPAAAAAVEGGPGVGAMIGKIRQGLRHAFAVDPPGPAEPTEEQREAVDWVCFQVARRGLTTPGIIALEMSRPLNWIGAQMMHFFSPGVWALVAPRTHEQYEHFAAYMERRGSFDYIAERVEQFEQALARDPGWTPDGGASPGTPSDAAPTRTTNDEGDRPADPADPVGRGGP